ncbi:uridine phosphorylase [Aequorivita sublithincola DSM 14238]|uniref:Uridine phosphorylase n=1 Tax=Aequorivita sublithincola (strain DSM 14238 / LMG 21431 / ACAM 643 / 9-3) TaxID=746697 RepID=I3YYV6_AEQSU|nr:nucleoside phosphorylase [Aequorivita sublithincola]AFL82174.1 uridine phosphorylase [Aequorivita sublithincola DSM 14238]
MKQETIKPSELILTPEGKIYHLDLSPSQLATTIITVGDPGRVAEVSKYFETIETTAEHREFKTHTGTYKGKRISVISTGIGPDNIDIVFSELDALVNLDFEKRQVKKKLTSLEIIRIGTSGGLTAEIVVDSFLISTMGIGLDNVMHYYDKTDKFFNRDFAQSFIDHMQWNPDNSVPYAVEADKNLLKKMTSDKTTQGITITNVGFYGPQGRVLRAKLKDENLNENLITFKYKKKQITNLEMETATMYAMAKLLGHHAISMNAIIANRATGTFSKDASKTIDSLIQYTLEKIVA